MTDTYPTDEELRAISEWPSTNARGWFDYIKSIWWNAEWGWSENGKELRVSTGGWSGNEDIISAMGDNFILWTMTWKSSRRGGHYEFSLPKES